MNFDDIKMPEFKFNPGKENNDTKLDTTDRGIVVGIPGDLWESELHHKLMELGLSDTKLEIICLNDVHVAEPKDSMFNLEKITQNMLAVDCFSDKGRIPNFKKEEPYYRKFDRKRKK